MFKAMCRAMPLLKTCVFSSGEIPIYPKSKRRVAMGRSEFADTPCRQTERECRDITRHLPRSSCCFSSLRRSMACLCSSWKPAPHGDHRAMRFPDVDLAFRVFVAHKPKLARGTERNAEHAEKFLSAHIPVRVHLDAVFAAAVEIEQNAAKLVGTRIIIGVVEQVQHRGCLSMS